MKCWQLEPLDSCFFRGAKPFNSGEGGFLDSQFPPTAQTLAGVIRAAIGEAKGVDWAKFRKGEQPEIADLIGSDSEHCGDLSFVGPYLLKDRKRLYPVPLYLLYSENESKWGRLQPATIALKTDQGMLRLPEVVEGLAEGAKPLENAWLDEDGLQQVLQGDFPNRIYREIDIFEAEARTGIGRDNETRNAIDGMLYFTRHIRLHDGVRLAMGVDGADDVNPAKMLRLGGEGRMAHVMVSENNHASSLRYGKGNHAMIVLLTHADFNGEPEPGWPVGIECVSACTGKAVREGGWDYKKRKPKHLKSLVPAGSTYFVQGDISKLATHLGERTEFGYGEIAIGIYNEGENV